jgi:hypothetical protein
MVDFGPANAAGFNGRESALVLAMFGFDGSFMAVAC